MKLIRTLSIVLLLAGVALTLLIPRTTYFEMVPLTAEEIQAAKDAQAQRPSMGNMLPTPSAADLENAEKQVWHNSWVPIWIKDDSMQDRNINWLGWTSPGDKNEHGSSWTSFLNGTVFQLWLVLMVCGFIFALADKAVKKAKAAPAGEAVIPETEPETPAPEPNPEDEIPAGE